jgi:hypothetical protein
VVITFAVMRPPPLPPSGCRVGDPGDVAAKAGMFGWSRIPDVEAAMSAGCIMGWYTGCGNTGCLIAEGDPSGERGPLGAIDLHMLTDDT